VSKTQIAIGRYVGLLMEKYTLVITEKPDAARRIALAVDKQHKPIRMGVDGVPCYAAENNGRIIVVPALGHLYTVAGERSGRDFYPIFAFRWVPRFLAERGAGRIRVWLNSISKLARDAGSFVDACDYDIEGSLIGYSIMKYACGNKEKVSKRMKYSTLTEEELERSYVELLPSLDFPLIEAGKTRHEVDWLYGINLSRALTIAAKKASGRYETLSTGRVQGPVLMFLGTREMSIKCFVPTPYWEMKAQFESGGRIFEAWYEETIETKRRAQTLYNECLRKTGQIEKITSTRYLQLPPFPLDLGTLQREAYRLFGYTPKRTLEAAQRLYLDALISYPRTSSQKLPSNIDHRAILRNLGRLHRYKSLSAELLDLPSLKPREGAQDDPAHPAIYPTGILPGYSLTAPEEKILDLVIRRFMAVFSTSAVIQSAKAHIKVGSHLFFSTGRTLLTTGWRKFYEPYVCAEQVRLPPLKRGQKVNIEKVVLLDKFSQPPSRYNPGSLLRKMEEARIGTKSTRADVLQILYDRKYAKNERIEMTDLGFEVLETLKNYCPAVVSVGLTRDLEQRMEKIQAGGETREKVLDDVVNILKPALLQLETNEKSIGEKLSSAMAKGRLEERILGSCPVCKTGKLMILRSKKTSKQFIGCSNYFKGRCSTSFALPQTSLINVTSKVCKHCGWPVVLVRARGRHAWMLCFNPECPRKRRREAELQNMP
jgi:DNA topoisomerase-1